MTKWAATAALALLVLALVLRVPRGELAEFKGDEAIQFETARTIAREGARPIRGQPTSDGPRTPVHLFYVMAAPLVLLDDPEAIRLEMALLQTVGIAALVLLGRRDLGGGAAVLAAGLLLATLPDLVRRGRWGWHPNLIEPFALAALLALARVVRSPRGVAPAVLLVLSGFLPAIHYSMIGLAALGVLTSQWAFFRGASRRALALAGLLLVVIYWPHFLGEMQNGFKETRAALAVAGQGRSGAPGTTRPEKAALAYPKLATRQLALGAFARSLGQEGEERAHALPYPLEHGLETGLLLLVATGLFLGARDLIRCARERARLGPAGVALAFCLAGWAPFLILGLPAREQYTPAIAPALAVLAGIVLAADRRGTLRLVAALLLAIVAQAGVLETRSALRTVDAGASALGSDYDIPIREKRAACALVLERELELGSYPRFEYLVLLEEAWRGLAPERARRFELAPYHVPYWEIDLKVPHPRSPRGRVDLVLVEHGASPRPHELARAGRIALVLAR